MYEEF